MTAGTAGRGWPVEAASTTMPTPTPWLDTPTRRCQETRAHYAHTFTINGQYINCPGGPDERPEK